MQSFPANSGGESGIDAGCFEFERQCHFKIWRDICPICIEGLRKPIGLGKQRIMLHKLYKCGFCRISLRKVSFRKLGLIDGLLALVGLRAHECPHCFGQQYRPGIPIGLPAKSEE